jgi:hypothetical protein
MVIGNICGCQVFLTFSPIGRFVLSKKLDGLASRWDGRSTAGPVLPNNSA